MNRTTGLARLVLVCLASLPFVTTASVDRDLTAMSAAVDTAFFSRDTDTLRSLVEELSSDKSEDTLYLLGYAHFRLAELTKDDSKSSKAHLNACIDALQALVGLEPDNAEAYALLGNCYGRSAMHYMLRAAIRGMRSDKAMRRAHELDPDNPRVLLLKAIGLYFRPALFGGDKPRATEMFRQAAERFADWQRSPAGGPNWGAAEAWAYLGYAQQQAGKTDQARLAYHKALQLRPDYAAVRDALQALEQGNE
ncbi:MAG TPA: hypothetical protein ENK16_02260 [Chromatiales bacterium]|nr:hypothetical protein [Chromatiales bacterium]